MSDDRVVVLGADEVATLLQHQEGAVLGAVTQAYAAHGRGETVVPHSAFLRVPGGCDRFIALPAYLAAARPVAGMKWIASFPGNVGRGLERACGVVVLNCGSTGRPRAVLEASLVSARRTAASAALAARLLHEEAPVAVGLLGCGVINFETLRFLLHVWPTIGRVLVCDLSPIRVAGFVARCRERFDGLPIEAVEGAQALAAEVPLLSIATTAMQPHLARIDGRVLRTVLHLSLRDLTPAVVLAADNVVDDADHVCRADTSLHLAEREVGHRGFIGRTLPAIVTGAAPAGGDPDRTTIFSPFGLGILDIAVAQLVWERAVACGMGTRLPFAARGSA